QEVTFSPDGKTIAASFDDGSAMLISAQDGNRIATLRGHRDRILALAFHTDGSLLATASLDGEVRLWRVSERGLTRLPKQGTDGTESAYFSVASPDRRQVAHQVSLRRMQFYALNTGRPIGGLITFDANIRGGMYT